MFFARVLSEQLDTHVDLRGSKQREDVVVLVQAALGVTGGERVLIDVVQVMEGTSAATELEQLVLSLSTEALPPRLPGPLTPRDMDSAIGLLDAAETGLPLGRLRDELAADLQVELPTGLSARQLFAYATELNVQPDGVPPAVLLLDRAAELTRVPGWSHALVTWAEGWAERNGLLAQLEQRRARRAEATPDPTIPRCLVVAVEPARDGSGDIVVRTWLNAVPGHWHPQPVDPEVTRLDDLAAAVERALKQTMRLSAAHDTPPGGSGSSAPPYVEFLLPYDLLNFDVAGLTVRTGDGNPLPLGLKYGVHLRSLERMRADDFLVRAQWKARWHTLQTEGITVHGWRAADAQDVGRWQAALAAEPSCTAAVLDAPDSGAATEALKAAVAEGIGLAVWDRRGEFPEERREVVAAVFAAVQQPARLPGVIHELRRRAELDSAGPQLVSRHLAFLWDDPNRLVDVHTTADHGSGPPGRTDTADSEETPV
ncbi:hypothetical protein [Streptomyces sp. NPDC053367]|uniref:VMAP-C domain-containing protein n=1 Tax=Streptomyces sp. NPDC053367 TaxID=3365700 RepID=UPI0037D5BC15